MTYMCVVSVLTLGTDNDSSSHEGFSGKKECVLPTLKVKGQLCVCNRTSKLKFSINALLNIIMVDL